MKYPGCSPLLLLLSVALLLLPHGSQAGIWCDGMGVAFWPPVNVTRSVHGGPQDFMKPTVLVVLQSSGVQPQAAQRRQMVRQTWLKASKSLPGWDHVFLIAKKGLNEFQWAQMEQEREAHGDIAYAEAEDGKGWNDPTRTLIMLQMVAGHPRWSQYDFLAKIDTDAWLNPFHLQRVLASLGRTTEVYMGRVFTVGTDSDRRVPYMYGGGYTLSMDWVKAITAALPGLYEEAAKNPDKLHAVRLHEDNCLGRILMDAMGWVLPEAADPDLAHFKRIKGPAFSGSEFYDLHYVRDYNLCVPIKALGNADADLGIYPPETVIVHSAKPSDHFMDVHEYFTGSLKRWIRCINIGFDHPMCRQLLEGASF